MRPSIFVTSLRPLLALSRPLFHVFGSGFPVCYARGDLSLPWFFFDTSTCPKEREPVFAVELSPFSPFGPASLLGCPLIANLPTTRRLTRSLDDDFACPPSPSLFRFTRYRPYGLQAHLFPPLSSCFPAIWIRPVLLSPIFLPSLPLSFARSSPLMSPPVRVPSRIGDLVLPLGKE